MLDVAQEHCVCFVLMRFYDGGGPHPTAVKQAIFKEISPRAAVVGEGEESVVDLCGGLRTDSKVSYLLVSVCLMILKRVLRQISMPFTAQLGRFFQCSTNTFFDSTGLG